jgi:hypothetical protein
VNLIPAAKSRFFRWSDGHSGAPEEVVKSEGTSDNPQKQEKRHAISITDLRE